MAPAHYWTVVCCTHFCMLICHNVKSDHAVSFSGVIRSRILDNSRFNIHEFSFVYVWIVRCWLVFLFVPGLFSWHPVCMSVAVSSQSTHTHTHRHTVKGAVFSSVVWPDQEFSLHVPGCPLSLCTDWTCQCFDVTWCVACITLSDSSCSTNTLRDSSCQNPKKIPLVL